MKNLSKVIISLSFLFLLISCSARKQPVVQQAPRIIQKERIISKPFDVVWQTAIEWFATHNTPIKNLDKSSGLISTEYSVSIGEASRYMELPSVRTQFVMGKSEISSYNGNFNVIIKKLGDNSTKINVNVFFGATINQFRSNGMLSSTYTLASSSSVTCITTGALEREILDYLEAGN